jgi:hypothetical protein
LNLLLIASAASPRLYHSYQSRHTTSLYGNGKAKQVAVDRRALSPGSKPYGRGFNHAAGSKFYPNSIALLPRNAALARDTSVLCEPQHELNGQVSAAWKYELSALIRHVSEFALDERRAIGKIDPDVPLNRLALIFSFFGSHVPGTSVPDIVREILF